MTKIVGTIRDVNLAGASGTMTIWSGFRPTTTTIIAPKRRTWDVENGVVPAGVEVAPGPAIVQLDLGPSAFRSWPVDIPNTEQVSIQELLFYSLSWGPVVPIPPPDEVADLLALIAQTAQEYETTLRGEVNAALATIVSAIAQSQQLVLDGEAYADAAEGHMAEALTAVQAALDHAEQAQALVGQADEALASTQALRDEAAGVQAQIESLNAQIGDKAVSIDAAVADGLAAADAAAASAAQASTLAGEASTINDQIAGHLATAQAAVAEGERQVLWAMDHAGNAEAKAQEASDYADQAATIVANAGDALAETEAARDAASAALSTIEGIGTQVDQIQTQVLALHGEVLDRHDEVLVAHGEAITAAANAAGAAGTAASEAGAAAADAATAAQKAIEATQAHAAALDVQEDVNARLAEAVAAAADAAGSAGEAAGDALAASQAQQAINAMQQQINADLVAVDTMHGEVLDRHTEVLTKHGEAIDAAAAAAASAGEAAGLATDTAVYAANAADEALSATAANTAAQEAFAQQQEQFNEDYAERVQLQEMMLEAVREAQAASLAEEWVLLTAHLDAGSGDTRVSIRPGITDLTVEAYGTWVGRIVAQAGFLSDSGTGVDQRDWQVPQPNGSRVMSFVRPNSNGGRIWSRVEYRVDPEVQKEATTNVGRFVIPTPGTVAQIPGHTFTAGAGGRNYVATFTLRWPYANYLERFVLQIRRNGAVIAEFSKFNIGPVFGEAARERTITATGISLSSGDQLTFHTGTSGGGNQAITEPSSTHVTWIAPA